ncbi:MAG: rhodanese-like domain-containing protein [Chloroflexi bacterium]|nr:rhodanese-like domain-containing protein [Chloroflexota bacterium]
MSLKKFLLLVLAVILVSGAVLTGGCAPSRTSQDVSPQEASTLLQNNQNNPDFTIIDVRTPSEFAGGHIADAVNIDYYSATFRSDIDKLDKSKTYLIYCHSGGRSGNTLKIMEELNFNKVYNLLGGIIAWEAARLPTVK